MAHYHYRLPYSGLALPQLVQEGHSCTCNPNKQRYAQSYRVFLCWPKPQVQGYHDERKALHPHSKPYSVLALPWLSLGGVILRTGNPGGPHQSPQTIRDTPKTIEYFFVYLNVKYVASMRQGWPSIPTHNPTLVLPYLSWV